MISLQSPQVPASFDLQTWNTWTQWGSLSHRSRAYGCLTPSRQGFCSYFVCGSKGHREMRLPGSLRLNDTLSISVGNEQSVYPWKLRFLSVKPQTSGVRLLTCVVCSSKYFELDPWHRVEIMQSTGGVNMSASDLLEKERSRFVCAVSLPVRVTGWRICVGSPE